MTPAAREVQLTLSAIPENVMVVRQAVAGLAEVLGLDSRRIDDLKSVVTEACNNVVLHAYDEAGGPLEVVAAPLEGELVVRISDHGHGFRPRPNDGEPSLGLGLPLIAALSDGFEISGGAGRGSTTTIRFGLSARVAGDNGVVHMAPAELALAITPGEIVKPVLARVIGVLAARAEFSVDQLADTVLLGDAVSSSRGDDFADGRLGISIKDGAGTLDVRVGPLVEGAGERLMAEMDLPGEGSLRSLAKSMEVTRAPTQDGASAEYLVFEVGR